MLVIVETGEKTLRGWYKWNNEPSWAIVNDTIACFMFKPKFFEGLLIITSLIVYTFLLKSITNEYSIYFSH